MVARFTTGVYSWFNRHGRPTVQVLVVRVLESSKACRERGVCYFIMIMGLNLTARLMCRYFSTPDSEAFSSTVDDPATLTLDQQGSPPAAGALGAERSASYTVNEA